MTMKNEFRKMMWCLGYDVSRFVSSSHPLARRKHILNYYGINVVLDVGANSGQFARSIRADLGYKNRIISFEPLSSAFEALKEEAKSDQTWEVRNIALGDSNETMEINIAANSYSSSILKMLPSHLGLDPQSKCIGKEIVNVRTLDALMGGLCHSGDNIYLKIDTQGFEGRVLKGASQSLLQIDTVQMEMSLVPLYDGESLFPEMCELMQRKGYSLISIEPAFSDRNSGQVLQVDGIFRRL